MSDKVRNRQEPKAIIKYILDQIVRIDANIDKFQEEQHGVMGRYKDILSNHCKLFIHLEADINAVVERRSSTLRYYMRYNDKYKG